MGTMATSAHGHTETGRSTSSRWAKPSPLRRALIWGVALGLAVPACRRPAVQHAAAEVRLYDLSGSKLLVCAMPQADRGQKKGFMRTKAPNGEVFQGEWVLLTTAKGAAGRPAGGYQPSLPIIPIEPSAAMSSAWGWASGLGIDFTNFPQTYWSFLLYGDSGTMINGFFIVTPTNQPGGIAGFLRSSFSSHGAPGSDSLIGAATDNRGHRYKVMG